MNINKLFTLAPVTLLALATLTMPASDAAHAKKAPSPTPAPTTSSVADTAVVSNDQDLPNLHEVHTYLFRGGRPTEAGLKHLKDLGVRTVVDFEWRPEFTKTEEENCQNLGMKFILMPVNSNKGPTTAQVDKFLGIVQSASKSSDRGAVFAHCHAGQGRTGAMIGIEREKLESWNFGDTYKEMLKYGFKPEKHSQLKKVVHSYASSETASK